VLQRTRHRSIRIHRWCYQRLDLPQRFEPSPLSFSVFFANTVITTNQKSPKCCSWNVRSLALSNGIEPLTLSSMNSTQDRIGTSFDVGTIAWALESAKYYQSAVIVFSIPVSPSSVDNCCLLLHITEFEGRKYNLWNSRGHYCPRKWLLFVDTSVMKKSDLYLCRSCFEWSDLGSLLWVLVDIWHHLRRCQHTDQRECYCKAECEPCRWRHFTLWVTTLFHFISNSVCLHLIWNNKTAACSKTSQVERIWHMWLVSQKILRWQVFLFGGIVSSHVM